MTIRKRRKKHRLRGERTHGHGNTKNARGAGTRGGRGKAGSHKHQFSKYFAQFGKEEKRLWTHQRTATINLDQIAQQLPAWAAAQKAIVSGTGATIDAEKCGFKKILARGTPTGAWTIDGASASAKARQKIESAGGRVKLTGEES
jgi:large subunit ribosomal protein L15